MCVLLRPFGFFSVKGVRKAAPSHIPRQYALFLRRGHTALVLDTAQGPDGRGIQRKPRLGAARRCILRGIAVIQLWHRRGILLYLCRLRQLRHPLAVLLKCVIGAGHVHRRIPRLAQLRLHVLENDRPRLEIDFRDAVLPALDLDDAAPRQRLCRTAQPDRLRLARARLKQRRIHARAQQLFQICGPLLFKEARNIHFAQRRHIGMQHLCVQHSRYNARVLIVKQKIRIVSAAQRVTVALILQVQITVPAERQRKVPRGFCVHSLPARRTGRQKLRVARVRPEQRCKGFHAFLPHEQRKIRVLQADAVPADLHDAERLAVLQVYGVVHSTGTLRGGRLAGSIPPHGFQLLRLFFPLQFWILLFFLVRQVQAVFHKPSDAPGRLRPFQKLVRCVHTRAAYHGNARPAVHVVVHTAVCAVQKFPCHPADAVFVLQKIRGLLFRVLSLIPFGNAEFPLRKTGAMAEHRVDLSFAEPGPRRFRGLRSIRLLLPRVLHDGKCGGRGLAPVCSLFNELRRALRHFQQRERCFRPRGQITAAPEFHCAVAPVAVSVTVVSDEQLRIYMSHGVRQKGFALLHIHGGAEKGFDILFFVSFFVFPVTAQNIVYFVRRQRNRTLRAGTPCFLYLFFCREQAQLP